MLFFFFFFFSSRRRHTRWNCDWSSDVCSSDLIHFFSLQGRGDQLGALMERGADIGRGQFEQPLQGGKQRFVFRFLFWWHGRAPFPSPASGSSRVSEGRR